MARKKDKEKAIQLRLEGKSYGEIGKKLDVGKGTLSSWLRDYPLPEERMRELRDHNQKRIERFRETMQRKRDDRLLSVLESVNHDIKSLTSREVFIAGLFLYWAEGMKTDRYVTSLSNTDPYMIRFFLVWLQELGASKDKIRVRLQLYSDMDVEKETTFWARELKIPRRFFSKPYIKKSRVADLSYRGGYGHGTCNIIYRDRDMSEYVQMGMKYIRDMYV